MTTAPVDRLRTVSEMLLVAMACAAPWAFGSVESWAQFLLASAMFVLSILQFLIGWRTPAPRGPALRSAPALALAGLMLLALLQASPLPAGLTGWIATRIERARTDLVPAGVQGVIDDRTAVVDPPASTACLEPEASRNAAAQLGAALVLLGCASRLGTSLSTLRRFGLAVVVNGTMLALFAMIQALTWDGKIYGFRTSPIANGWYSGGPFVCHNHLAAYLNLGIGFGLGVLIASSQRRSAGEREGLAGDRSRFPWIVYGVAVMLVGLLASHSRGGLLAMLAAAAITLVVLRPRTVRLRLGVLAVLLIAPLFLFAIGTDSPFQRLASISEAGASGLNGRTALWQAAIRTWSARPLLGAGLGNFEVALASALDRDPGVSYQHAENEYLEMAVEGGVVGLALLLFLMSSVLVGGYRALVTTESAGDRAWILGALFGVIALAVQSLGDFPLHVPGVAIPLVILAGLLIGPGRTASLSPATSGRAGRPLGMATIVDLGVCGMCLLIATHQYGLARAEAAVADAGFPLPGATIPGTTAGPKERQELEGSRARLRRALAFRPDAQELHFQLGLVELSLYSLDAGELLEPTEEDPDGEGAEVESLRTDPLWLLGAVHSAASEDLEATGGLLAHAPIRDHLVPAARSLLEARRCSPFRARVHANLAIVDYLIEPRESERVHLERALRLAGANAQVLSLAGAAAAQVGALDLAAESWRRSLLAGLGDWREIADMAREVLDPDQILNQVVPPGRNFEIWFADYLYTRPEDEEVRTRFLRAALERVPANRELPAAEQRWLQGQACARLGDQEPARTHMRTALSLEPRNGAWRIEYVTWLLDWGQPKEAHTQARIGVALDPYHPGLRNALSNAVDAMARSGPLTNGRDGVGIPPRDGTTDLTTRLGTSR